MVFVAWECEVMTTILHVWYLLLICIDDDLHAKEVGKPCVPVDNGE